MCTGGLVLDYAATAMAAEASKPEVRLAKTLEEDLEVSINPQALRVFIRARWSRVSMLAHEIHEGKRSA